jgi:hypothetical protein
VLYLCYTFEFECRVLLFGHWKTKIRARWNTAHTHSQNNSKALDSNRIAHIKKTQFFVLVKYESFLFLSYISGNSTIFFGFFLCIISWWFLFVVSWRPHSLFSFLIIICVLLLLYSTFYTCDCGWNKKLIVNFNNQMSSTSCQPGRKNVVTLTSFAFISPPSGRPEKKKKKMVIGHVKVKLVWKKNFLVAG